MNSASKLSREEKIRVCAEMYKTGMSTHDIESITGIGKSSVSIYLREAGIQTDGAARISAKMTGRPGVRKGATHTKEARSKISAARLGKPTTLGQKRTDAQRAVMSVAQIASGKKRTVIRSQRALFRKTPIAKLSREEVETRRHVRSACKSMLRRILTMARIRKDAKTEHLLGYSKKQLREHIESQFLPGMSWAARDSFHIDHKTPVAHFFRIGVYDPAVINALENLQPLTPAENRAKRDRVITITDAGKQFGIQELA